MPDDARGLTQHCFDFYSSDSEDKTPLNLPGWRPFRGNVTWENITELCPRPWRYASPQALQFVPRWGFFGWYEGGGFAADLGYNQKTARHVIKELQTHHWVDRQTRAVLVEFSIYNVNTGYFSVCTFFFEILPTGYGHVYERIETFPLTNAPTGFYQFYLVCQLLFILMVFYYVAKEAVKILRRKCRYFLEPWNLIDLFQVCLSLLVVVLFLVKSKLILNNILKLRENPFITISFQEAVSWNNAENATLSLAVFITTVKLLRMIRYNSHISALSATISLSRATLLSYSVLLFVIVLAFTLLGHLLYGADLYAFRSLQRTLNSVMLMSIGQKMQLDELQRVDRTLGPLFGFSFKFIMAFIFVNFFVAILNDSYEDVKSNPDQTKKESEMADFIVQRVIYAFLGIKRRGRKKRVDNLASEVPSCSSVGDETADKSAADRTIRRPPEVDRAEASTSANGQLSTRNTDEVQLFKRLAQNPHRLRRLRRKHANLDKLLARPDPITQRHKRVSRRSCKNPDKRPKMSSTSKDRWNEKEFDRNLEPLLRNLERGLILDDIKMAELFLCCLSARTEIIDLLQEQQCSAEDEGDGLGPTTLQDQAPDGEDSATGQSPFNDDEGDSLLWSQDRASRHKTLPEHLKKRGINERLRSSLAQTRKGKRADDQKSKTSTQLFFSYSYM